MKSQPLDPRLPPLVQKLGPDLDQCSSGGRQQTDDQRKNLGRSWQLGAMSFDHPNQFL